MAARPRKLGRALGIDEYARRKGHRYNTIIVDLDKGRPITTFKGRRVEDVVGMVQKPPARGTRPSRRLWSWICRSRFIRPSRRFLAIKSQVIDRFHVVKQAVEALDSVLRSVQKQLDAEEAKELKKLRKRWLKSANQLDVDELIARADWRRRFPELREVIDWVQDLRKWFERKYDKPAREALLKLIERARESALESLQSIAGTLSRWFEPIVRYIRHRYTNGMTEGFNNKIKLIQRRAFGLRNEHNRKKRILADCART